MVEMTGQEYTAAAAPAISTAHRADQPALVAALRSSDVIGRQAQGLLAYDRGTGS
jgi:hypothetical protein